MSTVPASLDRLARLVAVVLLAAACGDGEPAGGAGDGGDVPFGGAASVAGSDVREWSLLAVPRDGGTVEARDVRDPSQVVWTGSTRLPPAGEVHVLEGPLVVLRTPDGGVHRYDPEADELSRVAELAGDAVWTARGRYGVFAVPGQELLLQVGPEGAWRYEVDGRPVWAAPVTDGGVAVLVEQGGDAPELWLIRRGRQEPEARSDSLYRTPALVTAWGRRLAAVAADGGTVRFVAVPSLDPSGAVSAGGPVRTLAASPSSHELYVGAGSPPRVMRVSRFTGETRTLAETGGEVRAVRPSTLGGFLLVDAGGGPLWMSLAGGDSRRLDAGWRPDLPLGMPDGRVLMARDGELLVWDPADGGAPRAVEAPAGRWWEAVRWNPEPPAVVSGRVEGGRRAARRDSPATPGDAPRPPDSLVPREAPDAGERRAGRADTGSAAGADTADAASDSLRRRGELLPGHYAVVVAARDSGGVRRMLEDLSRAGYSTAMQRHRDDAGRLWYRGMVGEYGSRTEAEAAARQLRRERDLDVWITEVRAGAVDREVFP